MTRLTHALGYVLGVLLLGAAAVAEHIEKRRLR